MVVHLGVVPLGAEGIGAVEASAVFARVLEDVVDHVASRAGEVVVGAEDAGVEALGEDGALAEPE